MRCLGISLEGKSIKIAIVSKVKNNLTLEKLEEYAELPPALLQEKNLHIVTALDPEDVIRREATLKLTKQKAVLKALPFQLESLFPFSMEETLVHPFFYPSKEKTDVIAFATTRLALKKHLTILQEKGIEPHQISCVPIALARWARVMFPAHLLIGGIHQNTAVALEGEKIVFSQVLEDTSRLDAFLKNKFGHYFMFPSEGPSLQDFPYEKLRAFAIPIGLALDGLHPTPCQFRQKDFKSPQAIKKNRLVMRGSAAVALSLTLLVAAAGSWVLHRKEQALQSRIAAHFSAPDLPMDLPIDQRLDAWQKKLTQDGQGFPLLADVPSVRDVLAWLGNLQEPSVEIVQFHYSLVQYPKAGGKLEPYGVKIELEFKAPHPAAAHRFQEMLEKVPTLIDKKQKIAWTAQQESYKISFALRKV
ncbi:MAG: hypothetical protein JSS10_04240 [Verrucomicrobia bacterium]|nr:hypothetical protein [Verrucomicrobiota bacterium]